MAVNKVIVNNETKLDLTGDSVTSDTLFEGVTAHDASGAVITGTAKSTPAGAILLVEEGTPGDIYTLGGEQIPPDEAYGTVIKNLVSTHGDEVLGAASIEFLNTRNELFYIPIISYGESNGYVVARGECYAPANFAGLGTLEIVLRRDVDIIEMNFTPPVEPSTTAPKMDGTASAGSSDAYARGDHVHPTDTTRQAKLTGTKGQIVGFDESGAAAAQDDKAVMLREVQATLPSSEYWYSVTYGGGKFVAIAGGTKSCNAAAYSTDGITWTAATLPSSAYWASVTYGNGKFVAVVNGSNKAAYSTDGITWTAATLPSSAYWISVTYGNGKFVAVVNGSNKAAYSTDGITWTAATLPSSAESWYSVTYGNGKFVAVVNGSNKAAYSTDGITWTAATLPSSAYWVSVTYGNGKFVAVAYNDTAAAYSIDGITWTAATLPRKGVWQSVTYGNGKFVAIAANAAAAYSTDGITWTAATLPSRIGGSITYGNGKFVVIDVSSRATNKAAYSTDGITWQDSGSYLSDSADEDITDTVAELIQPKLGLSGKLDKSGGTMTGSIEMDNNIYPNMGIEFTGVGRIYSDGSNLIIKSHMSDAEIMLTFEGEVFINGAPAPVMPKARLITLLASDWTDNTQTVDAFGVLADETAQFIQVKPASASAAAYYESVVYNSGQAADSLTFACLVEPTEDLDVYVTMQDVDYS